MDEYYTLNRSKFLLQYFFEFSRLCMVWHNCYLQNNKINPVYLAAMRSCLSCFSNEFSKLHFVGLKKEQDAQDRKRQDMQEKMLLPSSLFSLLFGPHLSAKDNKLEAFRPV